QASSSSGYLLHSGGYPIKKVKVCRKVREVEMDDLVDVKVIAKLCSVTARTVIGWAAKGKIPGAYKINGVWRFNEQKVKRWIFEKEVKPCLFISGVKYTGSTLPSMGSTSASQLRQ